MCYGLFIGEGHTCAMVCLEKSENNLQMLFLSLCHVDAENRTQAIRLGATCFNSFGQFYYSNKKANLGQEVTVSVWRPMRTTSLSKIYI